jgi:serine/threonine protein kinase
MGGFATVYRCWQVAVGREVAVKVDNRALLSERDRRRFFREVTAAGRLSGHPHVIDVYDAGTLPDGRPYLVMELCPAGSLNDALRRDGPMDATRVRDIGIRLADALAAAHAAGVLHRDLKPANILVNRYGMVGLSDFGLASIISARGEQTASRDALTPAYSSPETFRGEEPTVLADVYSLAATLYALLAGRPPRFPAGSEPPSLMTIMTLHDKPVEDVPGTPPELMALLRAGLSADPARRPPSAAALRDALAYPARPISASPLGGPSLGGPSLGGPSLHGSSLGGPWLGSLSPTGPSLGDPSPTGPSLGDPPPTGPPLGDPPLGDPPLAGPPLAGPPLAGPPLAGPSLGGPSRPGAAGGHRAARSAAGGSRRLRWAGLAVGLVVIIAAGTLVGVRLLAQHGSTATPGSTSAAGQRSPAGSSAQRGLTAVASPYGVATVTAGCPAASSGVATARCPAHPECWGAYTEISGTVFIESLPCTQPHVYETFAIALMPAGPRTLDYHALKANPTVSKVCSTAVLLRSRQAWARRLPVGNWDAEPLPPSEAAFDRGTRTYRCVGANFGTSPSASQFAR